MRILQVIGQLGFGGAEILCANHAVWLKRHGHTVSIFSLQHVVNDIETRLNSEGVNIYYGALLSRPKPPPTAGLNIIGALRLLWHMLTHRYDVIHVHLFPSLYLVSWFARVTGYKGRLVYTEHSTENRRRSPKMKGVESMVYDPYYRIICISDQVLDNLALWLPQYRDKLTVIHNGIDLKRFRSAKASSRAALGLPEDKTCIVNVGGFRVEKNQKALIQAISHLDSSFHVVFVGDGVEMKSCVALAANLGVSDRITFVGDTNDVPEILKCCDLYVQVSLIDGFGIVCFEAMAAGLPVIGSNVPGLRDIIGPRGVYVEPLDPQGIAQKITQVSTNPDELERLIVLGEELSSAFDETVCFERIGALYSQLLELSQ